MAFQAIFGSDIQLSSKKSYFLLLRKRENESYMLSLSKIVFNIQLLLLIVPSSLIALSIHWRNETFTGEYTRYITSISWPCAFGFIVSGFMAQLYGSYITGITTGTLISYLCQTEIMPSNEISNSPDMIKFIEDSQMIGLNKTSPPSPKVISLAYEENEIDEVFKKVKIEKPRITSPASGNEIVQDLDEFEQVLSRLENNNSKEPKFFYKRQ